MLNYTKKNIERFTKAIELIGNKIELITDIKFDEFYYDTVDKEWKVKGKATGIKRKYIKVSEDYIEEYDDIITVEFNNIN